MNAADRGITAKATERVQASHDRLLLGIMTGKRK